MKVTWILSCSLLNLVICEQWHKKLLYCPYSLLSICTNFRDLQNIYVIFKRVLEDIEGGRKQQYNSTSVLTGKILNFQKQKWFCPPPELRMEKDMLYATQTHYAAKEKDNQLTEEKLKKLLCWQHLEFVGPRTVHMVRCSLRQKLPSAGTDLHLQKEWKLPFAHLTEGDVCF